MELNKLLEKAYNSTTLRVENEKFEYILSKEEEDAVVRNEIERLKNAATWRMLNNGVVQVDIDNNLEDTDWNSLFDRGSILYQANKRKHFDIQNKELIKSEKEKEKKEFEELKLQCDANYMYNLMAKTSYYKFGKNLIKNDDTVRLIKVICFFLGNDERFSTELGYDFKKGLWLRGVCGLGKTYLLTCVKDNLLKPINIYSMVDIYQTVKDEGQFKIDYSKLVYIDDVGTEENPVVKNYGTDINFFKNFIESYYLNSNRYDRLIVSTNVNFNGIESKYGVRARSRISDMFNVIDVTGKDLRG